MIKYWIKNRFIFDLVIAISLSLLFCFAFVQPQKQKYDKVLDDNFVYANSEVDYQIPNPSIEQLTEIKNQSFVEDVFGYYLTKTNVKGNNTSKVNLIMSDTMNSLSFTMYNGKTKLESSNQNETNYAYLDKTAADALKVSIGEEIKITLASARWAISIFAISWSRIFISAGEPAPSMTIMSYCSDRILKLSFIALNAVSWYLCW
jgi:hypothetical protein